MGLCLEVGFVGFILIHKVLSTDFVRCDINDITITSCIVYWDKHCVLRHYPVVSERGDMDSEDHTGDPEHQITL